MGRARVQARRERSRARRARAGRAPGFRGCQPSHRGAGRGIRSGAGPKTITRKITAEDAQKQVEELTDKLTSTKEQLDDAQRALQVQANRASARERGLHDHIAESSSEAKTRKQELDKLQRENKSLLEERQELKARLRRGERAKRRARAAWAEAPRAR